MDGILASPLEWDEEIFSCGIYLDAIYRMDFCPCVYSFDEYLAYDTDIKVST